ncbi:MAG: hypothetical protein MUO76_03040 [Anaerolineaceae bacterium]|nr:hypothetical protein [Anaerolineaceae bacterium]
MKGLLFFSGKYTPFQFYGPWTQKMPLAYLIPGAAQWLFEPGLRTGRYLSIFFSIIMLIGLWIVARRLGGRWWAALAIWAVALNPANIMNYSQAITQSIIACMVVWVLVFIISANRSILQTTIGAILAALTVLTRQNLLPFLVFSIAYIFWEHKRKHGWIALFAAALTLVIWHAVYWPNILSIWTLLPSKITPFLDQWRTNFIAEPNQLSQFSPISFLSAVFEGIRYNFFGTIGLVCSLLLWPARKYWKKEANFKISIFLAISILSLTLAHSWASFGLGYGYFTFSRYLSFFNYLGIILVIVSFPSWSHSKSMFRKIGSVLLVLVTTTGVAFSAYKEFESLLDIQVPRIRNMQILPGSTELWRLLENKFVWGYDFIKLLLPACVGFLFGVLLIFTLIIILKITKTSSKDTSLPYYALSSILIFGFIFSPTKIIAGGIYPNICDFDVIRANESVGHHIERVIPPGSVVFWHSNNSPTPLLYLQDIEIFPAQLDQDFTYLNDGDTDTLSKYGYWNFELSEKWKNRADILLITDNFVPYYSEGSDFSGLFMEHEPFPQTIGCRDKSIIHIFEKIK